MQKKSNKKTLNPRKKKKTVGSTELLKSFQPDQKGNDLRGMRHIFYL